MIFDSPWILKRHLSFLKQSLLKDKHQASYFFSKVLANCHEKIGKIKTANFLNFCLAEKGEFYSIIEDLLDLRYKNSFMPLVNYELIKSYVAKHSPVCSNKKFIKNLTSYQLWLSGFKMLDHLLALIEKKLRLVSVKQVIFGLWLKVCWKTTILADHVYYTT